MREAERFTVWFTTITGEKGELQSLPTICPKNCYQKYHVIYNISIITKRITRIMTREQKKNGLIRIPMLF